MTVRGQHLGGGADMYGDMLEEVGGLQEEGGAMGIAMRGVRAPSSAIRLLNFCVEYRDRPSMHISLHDCETVGKKLAPLFKYILFL